MPSLQTIGTYETKTHLADLLRRVRAGEGFCITQRGEPVADLLPSGGLVRRTSAQAAVRMMQTFTTDGHTAKRALGDTLQLARRFKLSAYHASYLELAMREGLPLATLDDDLRTAMAIVGTKLL